jgi:hypothetical protein
MSRRARAVLLVVATALPVVFLSGCPLPPPPTPLEELRLMLRSDVVAEVTPRVPDAIASARALAEEAEAALQARDPDRAAAFARLAQVEIRTAVALARQHLARERLALAADARAEADAEYERIEGLRQDLEARLVRVWAWRETAETIARDRARAVEEEALRAERLDAAARANWDRAWRAQAREDLADAERTLGVATLLGSAEAYPEIHRMAEELLVAARAGVDASPWRIERPLVDQAGFAAEELRFRLIALDPDVGPEAYAARLETMAGPFRAGFDPFFNVRLDPRGLVLAIDAKAAEVDVAFAEPVSRALDDLRNRWTPDPSLRCVVSVRSLDPACGPDCGNATSRWAGRLRDRLAGDAADRIRSLGAGYTVESPATEGLDRNGALRVEILIFPMPR